MLGTPPAFVLSQDQTLKKLYLNSRRSSNQSFEQFTSSKITQEFSLAVLIRSYTRTLKQIHLFVQGVIVCLYVIQFTRYRVHSLCASPIGLASELLYSSTSCRICQALFTSFSNSFVLFVDLQAFAFHRTTLLWYHRSFDLSRSFFLFFEVLWFISCRPAGDLHILAP